MMSVWLSQLLRRPAGAAPDLHEAHAAFEQSPREQAAAAEVGGRGVVEAVARARLRGLAGEVERLGRVLLHLGGEFVALDAGFEPRIARPRLRVLAVHLAEQFEPVAVRFRRDELLLRRRREVGDRRVAAGVEDRPRVRDRQEARR